MRNAVVEARGQAPELQRRREGAKLSFRTKLVARTRVAAVLYWLTLLALEARAMGRPRDAADLLLLLLLIAALPALYLAAAAQQNRLREATALAYQDELTRLPNRRAFFRWVEEQCRHRWGFALALLDVDGLKTVNESFGHQTGDEVLQAAAGQMVKVYGGVGSVFRIGGDEFAMVGSNVGGGDDRALELGSRLSLSAFCKSCGHVHEVSISVGAARHRSGEAHAKLIKRADEGLRKAKQQQYAQPSMDRRGRVPPEDRAAGADLRRVG